MPTRAGQFDVASVLREVKAVRSEGPRPNLRRPLVAGLVADVLTGGRERKGHERG
ncbi:hypothetical protein [Streptomyces sp. NBC_00893]|uniref:hypothetical protein n=1 Tax=Streptomyces sp. NBC_00893 TaxID=2975862 RepID=UPI00225687E2|nr:hypothetical protein [Streptomyces sp. NBC_00893]MCX4845071.1 hypothetical protein [Streptomyces sp. NBC_00893]